MVIGSSVSVGVPKSAQLSVLDDDSSTSTFCRLMYVVLKDLLYVQCLSYLDDIIVIEDSPEQFLERLDAEFSRLRQLGLKAKPSKCVFLDLHRVYRTLGFCQ